MYSYIAIGRVITSRCPIVRYETERKLLVMMNEIGEIEVESVVCGVTRTVGSARTRDYY